jgi:hypothetical protein
MAEFGAKFVFSIKNYIFVITKANLMKKLVVLVIVAGFLASCSQYTCPTYSKKEAPKKNASVKKI